MLKFPATPLPAPRTLWKTTDVSPTDIEPMTLVNETGGYLWFEVKQEGRSELVRKHRTSWERYHDSWEAARDFLEESATARAEVARQAVAEYEGIAARLRAMRPPTAP